MLKNKYSHTHKVILGVSLVISFSFLMLFSLSLSMTTDKQGNMSNCPFMSQKQVVCQMQVGEHVAKWQQAIAGIPQGPAGLMMAALAAFICWRFSRQSRESAGLAASLVQRFRHERGLSLIFNFLRLIFSQGILHPKIYHKAVI